MVWPIQDVVGFCVEINHAGLAACTGKKGTKRLVYGEFLNGLPKRLNARTEMAKDIGVPSKDETARARAYIT